MIDVRLIDANALYDTITDVANSVGHDVMAVEDVHRCIDKAPTIYAVKVVRCAQCKEYELDCGYCDYWEVGRHIDDYCSRGVRKMDDQDMDVPTKDGGAEG